MSPVNEDSTIGGAGSSFDAAWLAMTSQLRPDAEWSLMAVTTDVSVLCSTTGLPPATTLARRWNWPLSKARQFVRPLRTKKASAQAPRKRQATSQVAFPFRRKNLGIDLSDPHTVRLIARLYTATWAMRVKACGGDPGECLGEVYETILRRNNGKNPYDPERESTTRRPGKTTSLTTYCTWVIRSTVSHHLAKAGRRITLVLGRQQDVALSLSS